MKAATVAFERTMYRLLSAAGPVRERRDQLTHPPYKRPELLAEQPNEVWSLGHHQAARSLKVDLLLPLRDPRRLQPLLRSAGRSSTARARSWPSA